MLYGGLTLDVPVPPEWSTNPTTDHRYPTDVHWSEISDHDATAGDIKDVWELSRLGWIFPTLRRWATTGVDAEAERVWEVLKHWYRHNPPYRGPNWMCGQETSLRAISWMFLASALRESRTASPARLEMVADVVGASVGRVRPTLGYALSQRNNHAISEAGFLWTATLVVEGMPDANQIRRHAERALVEAVADQFGPDGSYAQHSPTYQRLAMHVLLWCHFVSRSTGHDLPPVVTDALFRGAGYLDNLVVDGSRGRVPNLGGNDGAHLFPLTGADIGDFRPLLAHVSALAGRTPPTAGPENDEGRWFGLASTSGVSELEPGITDPTDVQVLRRGGTYAAVRGGPFRHRPAHADQLHTDVWIDGHAVAIDAGSYRYTAPAPWGNALADESAHNVPFVPGMPQAHRRGRFLWTNWKTAKIIGRWGTSGVEATLLRLDLSDEVRMARLVAVIDGAAVVIDQASSPDACVRWRLAGDFTQGDSEDAAPLRLDSDDARVRIVGGGIPQCAMGRDDDPTSGWMSTTYGVRQPLLSVVVRTNADGRAVAAFERRAGALEVDLSHAQRLALRPFELSISDIRGLFTSFAPSC